MADANFLDIAMVEESSYGVAPVDPTMQTLRVRSSGLALEKAGERSATLRSDRKRRASIRTFLSAGGDMPFEWAFGADTEDAVRAACMSAYAVGDTTANQDLGIDKTGAAAGEVLINRALGDWAADGFTVGSHLRTFGFAASAGVNNRVAEILQLVSATQARCKDVNDVFVDEALGSATRRAIQRQIRDGVTLRTYSLQQQYTDLTNVFLLGTGQALNELNLEVVARQVATATMSWTGKDLEPRTASILGSGTKLPQPSTESMSGGASVGRLLIGTGPGVAPTGAVRRVQVAINNNARIPEEIGTITPTRMGLGSVDVSGSVEVYFETLTEYSAFRDHDNTGLQFHTTDIDGNVVVVTVRQAKFTGGSPPAQGLNEFVIGTFDFEAHVDEVVDPAAAHTLQFDFLTATPA